jgi:hypothetical protein
MIKQTVLARHDMRASRMFTGSKVRLTAQFLHCHCSLTRFRARAFLTGLLSIAAICSPFLSAQAGGAETTTTTLTLSSASVVAGQPVVLTATVTGNGAPITKGLVTFCDSTAAFCDGAAVLGTAQVTSAATASVGFYAGVGTYSIVAEYHGYRTVGGSTSTAQTLTVAGNPDNRYPSSTKIASSGTVGNYTLVGTVAAFGKPPLTATVSFVDTTNSDVIAGAASLDPSTLTRAFVPSQSSPIKGEPSVGWIVSGDFDEDGIPDLAILNGSAKGTIGIAIGDGSGGFGSVVNYNAGAVPETLAVADLNGDGHLDLVATDFNSSSISVLLGNGDGTFKTATTFPSASPFLVAVADFNADGVPDLVVSNGLGSTVSVLLGNGDGTFATAVTYPVGNAPRGIAIGDFNHDGVLDLAVSNLSTSTVCILLGNGDGTFGKRQLISTPGVSYYLTVGDLRRNGILDLIVPSAFTSNVYVLLGNNDGTFQTAVPYAVAAAPQSVSLGDINNDGILDLVVPDTGADGLVSVLVGNGDGTFAKAQNFTIGNNPINAALADFNGDGLVDISTSDRGSRTATVLLQQITETATATGVAVYGSGRDFVLASYPGDVGRASSQSTTVPLSTIHHLVTATTLMMSPDPASFGQSVTFTATVAPPPTVATGVSAGTVSFYSGATLLGTATVASGVATFVTVTLPVGADSITAVYSGNSGFLPSTSTAVIESVTLAPTTTALSVLPSPAASGQPVTVTATITPAPSGTPTGTVDFNDGTTRLGTSTVNESGTAVFITTSLPAGADSITATYSGNAGSATSTSTPVILNISNAPTYTLSASTTPFVLEQGGSVDIQIAIPPLGGTYSDLVTLSVSGLPPGSIPMFNPPAVIPGSTGAQTKLTLQLPAKAENIPAQHPEFPLVPVLFGMLFAVECLAFALTHVPRGLRLAGALAGVAGVALLFSGCSGGFTGGASTQLGTYRLTITGTSGRFHPSTTVTIVVK